MHASPKLICNNPCCVQKSGSISPMSKFGRSAPPKRAFAHDMSNVGKVVDVGRMLSSSGLTVARRRLKKASS